MLDRTGLRTFSAGALLAGVAVLLGAFGAHALTGSLSRDRLDVWETAVRYQMYHALAILIVGHLRRRSPAAALKVAAMLFGVGIVLFSGTLYVMAITDMSWLGAVTPLGGLAFIAGWVALAVGAWAG